MNEKKAGFTCRHCGEVFANPSVARVHRDTRVPLNERVCMSLRELRTPFERRVDGAWVQR